jgi:tripartite-type tricarboxylate transporter receptor subunit TctC
MHALRSFLFLFGFLAVAGSASAQYPTKPVTMIIPFAPGGASDFVGRILQPRLSELLGQQVIIVNRPGASGNIGLEAGAKAAPDGYTLYLGNSGTMVINISVFPKLAVTPYKDFIAVSQVVDVPGVLVAHPSFQANTVKELVAAAKAHPGKINYASPGSGSQNRLETENFRKIAGNLDMVHIPYKGGAGPAITGLVAGETHIMFVTASSAMPMIKSGRLKVYAITAARRSPELPNVPTMAEEGFPGFESGSWQGIFVPAGTPKPVVDRLFAVAQQTMKSPEVIDRLSKGGVEVVTSRSSAEFQTFVTRETEKWAKIVKESGATVD